MTRYLNWGSGIAAVYTVFAMSTVAFVTFAMKQPVDLVSADYYARSLEVDARQAARVRAASLIGFAIEITGDGRQVTVEWPAEQRGHVQGTATLYRPANSAEDRVVALAPDAGGRQTISLADGPAGRVIVQVSWQADGQAYYVERGVHVQ